MPEDTCLHGVAWVHDICLNPFRRIDTSSNTTVGLKNQSGTTFRRKKKIKDFRRNVAPLLFFICFDFSHSFPFDLPGFFFIKPVLLQKCSSVLV